MWRSKYLLNCFLLTLPVMAWNLLFAAVLPPAYQPAVFGKDIPPVIIYGESMTRILIFLLAFLMPLKLTGKTQKAGLALYLCGLMLYFASWLALMYFPDSVWSNSRAGFSAPAWTPLFWLAGIGLTGNRFYFRFPYGRLIYGIVCLLFLSFHNIHTWIVYDRIHL